MVKSIGYTVREIVAEAAGVELGQVRLEHPEVADHGDFSTNIALQLKGGRDLAVKIAKHITPGKVIAKVEVAGPGFINIWLQSECLISVLDTVLTQAQDFGKGLALNDRRVIVDYSSPNIAKPFGIGHLRSTIIGQAIYNLYKYLGFEVMGDNHLGDWGTQFGKLLYMIDLHKGETLSIEKLEEWYVEFHKMAEKNKEIEDQARGWFKKLEDGDVEARRLWQECVEVSMDEFNKVYDLLGVKIDEAYGESYYEKLMPEVIAEAKSKKIAKLSDGALVIETPGDKVPLMLLKSDGGTTYATRDLACLKLRGQKWDPEIVVYEVGAEQALYFKQLFIAAKMMGYVRDSTSLIHTRHGLYLAPDGKKFSTRKGKTVKLQEVLEEAIEKAKQLGCEDVDTAKKVGVGAVKYFDLSHNVQSDIVFDWDNIMALEGNSGPYLQYAYARTQSVLEKGGGVEKQTKSSTTNDLNSEELDILRYIYRFPEVVEEAAIRYSPNLLCNFLYELAGRFNTFYNQHSILSADSSEAKFLRLKITASVGQVLKNGLGILGIDAPDRM